MKFFTTLLIGILWITTADAANVGVVAPSQAVTGETIMVDVTADTQGESINAADITISYPSTHLKFAGVKKEQGVITLWIVPPHEVKPGTLMFSGVIPGGVERSFDPRQAGDTSLVLTKLLFVPITTGTAPVAIDTASLLRNDGTGNSLPIVTASTVVHIGTGSIVVADTQSPAPFTVKLLEKTSFGKSPRLAVFAAHDDDIEYYEVRINRGRWHRTTSPYPVPSRIFGFTLSVRAVDFAGNSTEQSISVPGEREHAQRVLTGLGLLLVILCIVYMRAKKRRL